VDAPFQESKEFETMKLDNDRVTGCCNMQSVTRGGLVCVRTINTKQGGWLVYVYACVYK